MTVLLRGGGDLASGVALRLHRAGIPVLITELPEPLAVRRMVSFSEAVFQGHFSVEGVEASRVPDLAAARREIRAGRIPVLVDPEVRVREALEPVCLVDARMAKRGHILGIEAAALVIGLGPGFTAGENCHAAIETQRGHLLGRVLWSGTPAADTGIPDKVGPFARERVLRAPCDGRMEALTEIGARVVDGQILARVEDEPVSAPFDGIVRGLLRSGLAVKRGLKIGDLDPRGERRFAFLVSDKALSVAGGVLEAILTREDIREKLWR